MCTTYSPTKHTKSDWVPKSSDHSQTSRGAVVVVKFTCSRLACLDCSVLYFGAGSSPALDTRKAQAVS